MTNGKQVSELTTHIGYWMRMVSNNVSHSFAKKLERSGVTVAEWVVLRKMYDENGAISSSTIADLTGLTRGAISKLVDRLNKKDLLNRNESSTDRRFQEIELTAKALALTPKLAEIADKNDEEFFSALTNMERKQLKEMLKKLATIKQLTKSPLD